VGGDGVAAGELERLIDAYTDIVWNTLHAPVLGNPGAKRGTPRNRQGKRAA
jgi:hypothetical protein